MAEGVGFEPTRERNPLPVFKTGALNHSATLPYQQDQLLSLILIANNLATETGRGPTLGIAYTRSASEKSRGKD